MREKAVCLVSGGMDSCVAAAVARNEGFALAFLHASYGQRTAAREYRAFRDIADWFGVQQRWSVDLKYLGGIGGSALTDTSIPLPKGKLDRDQIPASYVPFRNANLLAIATSWAEILGAHRIYIGAVEQDSSGYPDCRLSFFEAFDRLIREGTRPETRIRVVAPLIRMRKEAIVRKGILLGAPLELSWSCYQSSDIPCNECDSCLLRKRGFEKAGVPDPLLLRETF